MKKMLLMLVFTLFIPLVVSAVPKTAPIPLDVYEWVQSSERAGYWFNKTQIYYGCSNGKIDKNCLLVAILKVYDDVQINEVKMKRRWRDESLKGYEILAGAAEYLEFNLSEKSVIVKRREDLDNTWTVLSKETINRKIFMEKMSVKNKDKKFYSVILNFTDRHKDEIMERSLKRWKIK